MSEPIWFDAVNGLTVYATLDRPLHPMTRFDFGAGPPAFVAIGTGTTPYVAATEEGGHIGANKSRYVASLNLAQINPALSPMRTVLTWYSRLGGSPAPATDTWLGSSDFYVMNGERVESSAALGAFSIGFDAVLNTAGTSLTMTARLRYKGKVVVDGSATCVITCRPFGSDVLQFTNPGSGSLTQARADGSFEATQATPGFASNTEYVYTVTIVYAGVTFTESFTLPVIG